MTLEDSPGFKRLPLRDAYQFGDANGLEAEITAIRGMNINWHRPRGYDSRLRRGYIIALFEERGIFQIFKDRNWPNGDARDGIRRIQNSLNLKAEYELFLSSGGDELSLEDTEEQEGTEEEATSTFAYEADLRDYLAQNLHIIEPGLALYTEGVRDGVEYPIEGGRIDILAKDQTGQLVVIELKLSRGRSSTIGQLAYYIGWVNNHLAGPEKSKGIIIASEVSRELTIACQQIPNISLYEYSLAVTVEKIYPT